MHAMEAGDAEQLKAWSETQLPPATKEYVLAGYYRTVFQMQLSSRYAKACYDQSSNLSIDHHLGLALSCGELLAGNYRIAGHVGDWARTMQAVRDKVYDASARALHSKELTFYGFISGSSVLDMKSFYDFPVEIIRYHQKGNAVIPRVLRTREQLGTNAVTRAPCQGIRCEGLPYYINVNVNGHGILGVFDTGANPTSAIPVSEISRLGVQVSSSPYYPSRSGNGELAATRLGYVKSIRIPTEGGGEIELRNVPVVVGGQFPDGLGIVLGLNVISKLGSVLIEQHRVVVHPHASNLVCKVPMHIASTLPVSSYDLLLRYSIDGRPRDIFLDTGSSEFLVGTAGVATKPASTRELEASGTGATGTFLEKYYSTRVQLGSGADSKDLAIRVYTTPFGPYPYAMGAKFLREYKVFLDFEQGTACLIPVH